ncbi:MAG TPA: hypothetical protein VLK82_17930 [Candidatus Tectomicrobia bacterium]|nr:hypothetical protein [Candidatus Tectomicrobia bacterium]
MVSMQELIVIVSIVATVTALVVALASSIDRVVVVVDREETPEERLRGDGTPRDAAAWREDALLADVITELYRELKREKIHNTVREDGHGDGISAPKNRA